MLGLLMAAALLLALGAVGYRRFARVRRRRQAAALPGASAELAVPITGWDEMDPHLARRRCERCAVRLAQRGEGARQVGGRRLWVARLECPECETTVTVWFDTSGLLH